MLWLPTYDTAAYMCMDSDTCLAVCLSAGMTIEDVREFKHKMQENTNKLVLDGVEPRPDHILYSTLFLLLNRLITSRTLLYHENFIAQYFVYHSSLFLFLKKMIRLSCPNCIVGVVYTKLRPLTAKRTQIRIWRLFF